MHDITKQSVLKAFQQEKTLTWDDFTEKEIFFDIGQESERSTQLRNVLADLIKEGLIMLGHEIRRHGNLLNDLFFIVTDDKIDKSLQLGLYIG